MKIAEIINEMKEDLEAQKVADLRIMIWKQLYAQASDYEKRKMLEVAFKELAGFTEDEIRQIFNP